MLQADKIVHEQQLGLNWFPPSEHIFQAGGQGAAGQRAAQADGDGDGGPISRGQMDNENIKRMLELLCNEAGFLVEGKIQKLLDPLPPDEQNLLKIDSILKARHPLPRAGSLLHRKPPAAVSLSLVRYERPPRPRA